MHRRRSAINGCRKGWRLASLTACSAIVVAAAGCGSASSPKLDRADAAPLIALARRIAAETGCTQARDIRRLRTQAIALVNRGRVPQALQEPMLSGVAALAELAPSCRGDSA